MMGRLIGIVAHADSLAIHSLISCSCIGPIKQIPIYIIITYILSNGGAP